MRTFRPARRSTRFGPALAALVVASFAAIPSAGRLQAPPPLVLPDAHAGAFYPEAPAALKAAIEGYVRDAVPTRVKDPRVLVVPHAGIIFSGQIAADAFAQTRGMAIETVILLGANHTTRSFSKASVFDGQAWATPLGTVSVDRPLAEAIVKANVGAVWDRTLHEREHSIAVQLPFLQVLHPRAAIVPIVIGSPDPALCERLGKTIARLTLDRRVLIVASSDLAHYPAENDARRLDAGTLEAIVSGAPASLLVRNEQDLRSAELPAAPGLVTRACGLGPLLVATEAARALGAARGVVLSYANSADTVFGTPDRVVGYGAVAFAAGAGGGDSTALAVVRPEGETTLDAADKRVLLRLARETLARQFDSETAPLPRGGSARLQRTSGAFVTLKVRGSGALRGCVGRIAGDGPLIRLVSTMSLAAAFADRRFTPLTKRELPGVEIEVSVLTAPRQVRGAADIVLGRDGVVLQLGDRSAVFLPYVAEEQGWSRDDMLDNLAVKAGLDRSAWRDRRAKFLVFQTDTFSEATVR
jgi:MEMO1 family protein